MLIPRIYNERLNAGFSLLEVMVSMSILAVSLVAMYTASSQAVKMSERAGLINTAMNLARARMGEIELELLEKGFEGIPEKDAGRFEDENFRDYRWEYKADKISIPLVAISKDTKTVSENQFLKMGQDMLEKSIKEVRLKIYYMDGKREDFVELVTHFNNPKDLPIVQQQQQTQ